MELKFAMLADWFNETKEGKANIIGEFNLINARSAPVTHGPFSIIARFEAKISEGTEHTFRVGLYDEDGQEVLPQTTDMPLPFQNTGPGRPLRGQVIVRVDGVVLPKFGDYEFHLLIDGRHMASVPFSLVELKASGAEPQ